METESEREMLMADEELLDETGMTEGESPSVKGNNANGNNNSNSEGDGVPHLSNRRGSQSSSVGASANGSRRTSSRQATSKREGFYQEPPTNIELDSSFQGVVDNAAAAASYPNGIPTSINNNGRKNSFTSMTNRGFDEYEVDRKKAFKMAMDMIKKLENGLNEFNDLFYKEKLERLKHQIESLYNGTYLVYTEQVKRLELEKKNRIWLADIWKKNQLECFQSVFTKEREAIEVEYKTERDGLREKLTNKLLEKKKKVEEESASNDIINDINGSGNITITAPDAQGNNSSRANYNTRKLRKRNAEQANDRSNNSKKKQTLGPTIVYEAKDYELNEDLSLMRRAAGQKSTSSTRRSQYPNGGNLPDENSVDVHFEGGVLYIDEKPFRKTENIKVTVSASGESFQASIVSINSTDMWVQKQEVQAGSTGKLKIYMSQLRNGKYFLEVQQ